MYVPSLVGPSRWTKEYPRCSGRQQSPIDIDLTGPTVSYSYLEPCAMSIFTSRQASKPLNLIEMDLVNIGTNGQSHNQGL